MNSEQTFEVQKNRKAFTYTLIICGVILLLFLIISWKVQPPTQPVVQDLIEINLGNDEDGFGEIQPLIKGERSPAEETQTAEQAASLASSTNDAPTNVIPDENAAEDAAPVVKSPKVNPTAKPVITPTEKTTKTNNNTPVAKPAPKPAKPKMVYDGPGSGKGNNATEDNGYKSQGNTPGKTGDNGSPTGDKDSYGNTPGGKKGGPKVIRGNRKVVNYYSFPGDLPKATIYAEVSVSPTGRGTFVRLVKPSTSFSSGYSTAIKQYLTKIQFDKAATESDVTLQFNFTVQ